MAKNIAYIFPGQGAQFVGMGKDFYENFDAAKNVYNVADSVLDRNISSICFNGSEEDLKLTINTQPCLVATEIAILEALKTVLKDNPIAVAGHSLGEYSAMYCAGVMDLENTFKAIQKRAEKMSKAPDGKMVAVITDEIEKVENCLKSVDGIVSIANYNSLKQVVITGEVKAVDKAVEQIENCGVKKLIPLAVSGGFHSELMKNVAFEFSDILSELTINDSTIPVYTNIDAMPESKSDNFRLKMPKQIYSSVLWTQSVQNMIKNGVDTFIEIGPGKVLTGLIRKIDANVNLYNIYDLQSMEDTTNKIIQGVCYE